MYTIVAASFLVVALPLTDEIGFAAVAAFAAWHVWRSYVVETGTTEGRSPVLKALSARIKGSAAGMEPPDDAVLKNGWFEYTPRKTVVPELRLTRSEFTADYDWCVAGKCQRMSDFIASDGGVTSARPCIDPGFRAGTNATR
jgi:hypothetical protein